MTKSDNRRRAERLERRTLLPESGRWVWLERRDGVVYRVELDGSLGDVVSPEELEQMEHVIIVDRPNESAGV